RAPQDAVVVLEALAVEAGLRPGRDADALRDDAPDADALPPPPRDRLVEVVRAEPGRADDDPARRPLRDELERPQHRRDLDAARTGRDDEGVRRTGGRLEEARVAG